MVNETAIGSDFHDFLAEENLLDDAQDFAERRLVIMETKAARSSGRSYGTDRRALRKPKAGP